MGKISGTGIQQCIATTRSESIELAQKASAMVLGPGHRAATLSLNGRKEHFVGGVESCQEQFERAPHVGPSRVFVRADFRGRGSIMLPLILRRMPRLTGARTALNCSTGRRALPTEISNWSAVSPRTNRPDQIGHCNRQMNRVGAGTGDRRFLSHHRASAAQQKGDNGSRPHRSPVAAASALFEVARQPETSSHASDNVRHIGRLLRERARSSP